VAIPDGATMPQNSPFEDIERIVEEVQKRLDTATVESGTQREQPNLDLVEHDEEYVVTVDLPGFEAADVDVELVGRTLTIDAEQSTDETVEGEDGQFIRQERSRSTSMQQIEFPASVSEEDATATMQNGVLTVTVPKADLNRDGTSVDIE
jgi:HSP20 family protein